MKKFPTNDRGFCQYGDTFRDVNNSEIRVVQSSLATDDAVHIFCDEACNRDNLDPHLNIAQARELIARLRAWIADVEPAVNCDEALWASDSSGGPG